MAQRLYDRAVGRCSAPTSRGRLGEGPLHAPQIGNLAAYGLQVREGRFLHVAATVPALGHPEKVPYLVKADSQFAAAPDEDESPQMLLGIEAMPSAQPRRPQPDLLVIANRLDLDARAPRQLPDPEFVMAGQRKRFVSVATTDCMTAA